MRNFIVYPALLLVAALLTGCISAQATMLSNESYPPVPPEEVTLYLAEEDLPEGTEKVAIINLEGSSTWTNEKQMYEKAREKAGEVGANGVFIPSNAVDEPSTGAEIAGAVFGVGTTREGEVIAVRVPEVEE